MASPFVYDDLRLCDPEPSHSNESKAPDSDVSVNSCTTESKRPLSDSVRGSSSVAIVNDEKFEAALLSTPDRPRNASDVCALSSPSQRERSPAVDVAAELVSKTAEDREDAADGDMPELEPCPIAMALSV